MEVVEFDLSKYKLPQSWMLPEYKELRIVPLGDIQLSEDTDILRLVNYVNWIAKNDMYVIGMGDYVDAHSPSNRVRLAEALAGAYDSTINSIDVAGMKDIDTLYEIFKPLKGRVFGMIRGHHFCQFSGSKGDSTTILAKQLDSRNLGDCAAINLNFGAGLKATIWAHHGTGSGMTSASPMNRLEHMTKVFHANIYLMGHQHKKGVSVLPWIDFKDNKQIGMTRYIVATGSFYMGYKLGSKDPWGNPAGGYVEKGMLIPAALGAPLLMIRPIYDQGRVDINVSV